MSTPTDRLHEELCASLLAQRRRLRTERAALEGAQARIVAIDETIAAIGIELERFGHSDVAVADVAAPDTASPDAGVLEEAHNA